MMKSQSVLLTIAILLISAGWAAAYSGGNGSETDPYQISTPADMQAIGANTDDWDKHFILTANIDLADYTGTQFNIIGEYYYDWDIPEWVMNPFTGVFDGNEHIISNFTYEPNGPPLGIFCYVDAPNALIKNLHIAEPNIVAGVYANIGALVGCLNQGTISNCRVTGGSISASQRVGGLVGYNEGGTIENCYSTCSVEGTVSGICGTGGLVGSNYQGGLISNCYSAGPVSGVELIGGLVGKNIGTIVNCYSTGCVSGDRFVGGLVGLHLFGTIENCYSSCSVMGNYRTGGLVGGNWSEISNCYAVGSVTGTAHSTGGLVGNNVGGTVSNCYATDGSVSGNNKVGGLVGFNENGEISNCYAAGSVVGDANVGGFAGINDGIVNASFWDVNSSNMATSDGGEPKTTEQMQTMTTFTDAGWDFSDETTNGIEDIWRLCEDGTDYPKLAWQMLPGDFVCGDGVDFNDLDVFMQQWLQFGAYCADIAPSPGGDGVVDMLDFAVFAEHWLKGVVN